MANEKLITLGNLGEFKGKLDANYLRKFIFSTDTTLATVHTTTNGSLCVLTIGGIQYIGQVVKTSSTYSIWLVNDTKHYYLANQAGTATLNAVISLPSADLATVPTVELMISNAISGVYKVMGSESVANLNAMTKTGSLNGNVYNLSNSGNLNNQDGTTIAVTAGDNVVFIYPLVGGSWYWDKLAATIDASAFVPTSRTIAGNALTGNIGAQALTDSLVLATNTEIDNLF